MAFRDQLSHQRHQIKLHLYYGFVVALKPSFVFGNGFFLSLLLVMHQNLSNAFLVPTRWIFSLVHF